MGAQQNKIVPRNQAVCVLRLCVCKSESILLLKERFLPPSLHTFRTVPEDQKHLILNFPPTKSSQPNLKTERTTQAKPELVRRPTEKKHEPSQQQSLSTIKIVSHL